MDLTPGEKSVLAQIGAMYREAAGDQLVRALMGQWLAAHYGPYSTAYAGLINKGLVTLITAQKFRLTRMGLSVLGVAPPTSRSESPHNDRPQAIRPMQSTKRKSDVRPSVISRFFSSVLNRR